MLSFDPEHLRKKTEKPPVAQAIVSAVSSAACLGFMVYLCAKNALGETSYVVAIVAVFVVVTGLVSFRHSFSVAVARQEKLKDLLDRADGDAEKLKQLLLSDIQGPNTR